MAAIVTLVLAADQATKTIAENNLAHPLHLIGPLSFELVYNSGVAFSLGSGNSLAATAVESAIVLGLVIYARRVTAPVLAAGFGLVIGGALGNIADRLFRHNHGAVIDFIHTSFWPTFNLADSAIVIGIIFILYGSRRGTHRAV